MTAPTGRPRGRPPGSKNKRTHAREQATAAAAEKIAEALGEAFDGDAHALLMSVYKDPAIDLERRIDAAKAAIRYEKPALATVETTGKGGEPLFPAVTVEFRSPAS